jgi:hypothetical protein
MSARVSKKGAKRGALEWSCGRAYLHLDIKKGAKRARQPAPRQGGVRFGGMGPSRAIRGPLPPRATRPVEDFDRSCTMILLCAFATRRFEDGSAAFQMEPRHLWEPVTAPDFPVGERTTASRFVRRRRDDERIELA